MLFWTFLPPLVIGVAAALFFRFGYGGDTLRRNQLVMAAMLVPPIWVTLDTIAFVIVAFAALAGLRAEMVAGFALYGLLGASLQRWPAFFLRPWYAKMSDALKVIVEPPEARTYAAWALRLLGWYALVIALLMFLSLVVVLGS
jgi:hypothetical protein